MTVFAMLLNSETSQWVFLIGPAVTSILLIVGMVQRHRAGGEMPVPGSVMLASTAALRKAPGTQAVTIVTPGPNKIASIKALRSCCPEHSLAAGKYLVDHVPAVACAGVLPWRAMQVKQVLEAAGMTVSMS